MGNSNRRGWWIALAFAATGCVRHLTPSVQLQAAARQLPFSAVLVIPDELARRVDTYGSFATLGGSNTWVCDTGQGLVPALESLARSTFRDVKVVRTEAEAPPGVVVLAPSVTELRQMGEKEGFWVSFALRARVLGTNGTVALDDTCHEQREGSTAAAVFGGAFAASAALLSPTEEGMRICLDRLGQKLQSLTLGPPPGV